MKYYLLTLALLSAACSNAGKPLPDTTNTTSANHATEKRETAIAHSLEKQTPPSGDAATTEGKSKWTQGGEPIDTREYDAAIVSATAAEAKNPSDPSAKKALGDAFYKRADALTKARQYAAALGDYRK